MKYQAQVEDTIYEIDIDEDGRIRVDGETVEASLLQVGVLGLYSLLVDHESVELVVEETQHGYRVMLGSHIFDVKVADERQLRLAGEQGALVAPTGDLVVKAPIPGLVTRVLVNEGDEVEADQPLAILEAMKMENELRAQRAGVVSEIKIKPGENVEQGAELFVIH